MSALGERSFSSAGVASATGLGHAAAMSWFMSLNPWLVLVVAGLFEVMWASGIKYVGVQRPLI
jgi:hypothetical protein